VRDFLVLGFWVSLRCLPITESIADVGAALSEHKSDYIQLNKQQAATMLVWGGTEWSGNAVLHAVLGRLRLYQYSNRGDSRARAISYFLFLRLTSVL